MSKKYSSDSLHEQFAQVMNQTRDLVNKVEQLQAKIITISEENVELLIENKHLRQMIKGKQSRHSKNRLSGSRQDLKELYQQGFHVCSEYYGKHPEPSESYTFYLDTIFGHEQGMTK